jgi:hypothetical protein
MQLDGSGRLPESYDTTVSRHKTGFPRPAAFRARSRASVCWGCRETVVIRFYGLAIGEKIMWILLFVLSHHSVPPGEVKFAPTIVMQEFSSRERCEAAKSFILAAFGDDPAKMTEELQRRYSTGDLGSRQKVILKARCTRK